MQTIKFYTVGCKVNQYETQAIREQFARCGFKEIDNGKASDIYLINTCTVTHKADRDSRRLIYLAHRENPRAKIIATGCYTELDSEKIAQIPGVTHIIKNQDKNKISQLLKDFNETTSACRPPSGQRGSGREERLPAGQAGNNEHIGITGFAGHTRAFLKIQDGCNNFCSYCKVSLVRSKLWSKPIEAIIREAEALAKNGFKEIVLCGICLGSYGKEFSFSVNLADVITALEKIEGLSRIRLSSIEAGDVSDSLIEKMAQSKKLCRHLHIPMQSGDDKILRMMNRRYSRSDYLSLIKKIKNQVPQIAITTDVLVGFPGETEVNFRNTVKLIKQVNPLKTHIFSYSKRIGTAAANFKDEVSREVVRKRMLYLKEVSDDCALVYTRQFLNKEMEVLVESQVKAKPGYWEGHTDNYIKVSLKSKCKLHNKFIFLKLNKLIKGCVESDLY